MDYKKLRKKFKKVLNKTEINTWLNFDKERMENNIYLQFSEEIVSFNEIIKLDYYSDGLYLTLPILVCDGDYHNHKVLFKTKFVTKIKLSQLKKYEKSVRRSNVEEFFEKNFPESTIIKDINLKYEQWVSKEEPQPIDIDKSLDYIQGTEFIVVNLDTSFYGNFQQIINGVLSEGCHLRFGKNIHYKELNDFIFKPNISTYNIPYSLRNKYDDNDFYNLPYDEKTEIMKSFGLKVSLKFLKESLKNKDHSIDEHYSPYMIRLSGNDDDSWTKYFADEESMMEEVFRLRRCQPIDKQIDVINNNYYFTN